MLRAKFLCKIIIIFFLKDFHKNTSKDKLYHIWAEFEFFLLNVVNGVCDCSIQTLGCIRLVIMVTALSILQMSSLTSEHPYRVYVTFVGQKTQCPQINTNLHSLKIMIVDSFPENITCWGAVVFGKWVKQCHENNLRLMRQTYFH